MVEIAEVAVRGCRRTSTIIQHVAGVNVQVWSWYKAQVLCSIFTPQQTQSATADKLQTDCCFLVSGLEVCLPTGLRFTPL